MRKGEKQVDDGRMVGNDVFDRRTEALYQRHLVTTHPKLMKPYRHRGLSQTYGRTEGMATSRPQF